MVIWAITLSVILLLQVVSIGGSSNFFLPEAEAASSPYITFNWKSKSWKYFEVKVENKGNTSAKNMYIWVAWDKNEKNKVWDQKKYGPFTLKPGWWRTVNLTIDKPPGGEWTRQLVSVWGSNVSTLDSKGDWTKRTCGGGILSISNPSFYPNSKTYVDGNYVAKSSSWSKKVSPGWYYVLVQSFDYKWNFVTNYHNTWMYVPDCGTAIVKG